MWTQTIFVVVSISIFNFMGDNMMYSIVVVQKTEHNLHVVFNTTN